MYTLCFSRCSAASISAEMRCFEAQRVPSKSNSISIIVWFCLQFYDDELAQYGMYHRPQSRF